VDVVARSRGPLHLPGLAADAALEREALALAHAGEGKAAGSRPFGHRFVGCGGVTGIRLTRDKDFLQALEHGFCFSLKVQQTSY
jgi:hypothetical protein